MNITRRHFLIGLTASALPSLALAQNHSQHRAMSQHGHGSGGHQGHMQGQQGHMQGQQGHMQGQQGHMSGMNHDTKAGRQGHPQDVSQTIQVDMQDQKFTPNRVEIKTGETVRFFVRNMGQSHHEFVIGTRQELSDHAKMMQQNPNMAHQAPHIVSLKPRQRGGVVWTFDQPGTYYFACLKPGHMDNGMIGEITVIN